MKATSSHPGRADYAEHALNNPREGVNFLGSADGAVAWAVGDSLYDNNKVGKACCIFFETIIGGKDSPPEYITSKVLTRLANQHGW
jgi:hypothetical protein